MSMPSRQESSLLTGPAPAEATEDVAKLYALVQARFGAVPEPIQLMALNPLILENQLRYMGYFEAHPRLSRPLLAALRLLVAMRTKCRFCVDMNMGMLLNFGWSLEHVEAVQEDVNKAPLPTRELLLLEAALRAVEQPLSLTADDIAELRFQGWTEADIFDAVHHGAQARASDTVIEAFRVSPF